MKTDRSNFFERVNTNANDSNESNDGNNTLTNICPSVTDDQVNNNVSIDNYLRSSSPTIVAWQPNPQ